MIAVILEMYELKKATVVVMEVTSMERSEWWRVLDTRDSNLVVVVQVCSCHTRDRMNVSSAPTPRAMITARMFMKGKNESLKMKV